MTQAGSVVADARRDELAAADQLRKAIASGDVQAGAQAMADWIDARAFLAMYTALEADDALRMRLN